MCTINGMTFRAPPCIWRKYLSSLTLLIGRKQNCADCHKCSWTQVHSIYLWKLTLQQTMKAQSGSRYSFTLSLTSVLEGVGGER